MSRPGDLIADCDFCTPEAAICCEDGFCRAHRYGERVPVGVEPWVTRLQDPHPPGVELAATVLMPVTRDRRAALMAAYTLADAGLLASARPTRDRVYEVAASVMANADDDEEPADWARDVAYALIEQGWLWVDDVGLPASTERFEGVGPDG